MDHWRIWKVRYALKCSKGGRNWAWNETIDKNDWGKCSLLICLRVWESEICCIIPLLLYILESNLPMISTPLLAFIGVSHPTHKSVGQNSKSVWVMLWCKFHNNLEVKTWSGMCFFSSQQRATKSGHKWIVEWRLIGT